MASAKEVLEVVRMNVTAAEVLKHVYVRTHESKGTESMVGQITLDRVNWLDECSQFDQGWKRENGRFGRDCNFSG